MNINWNRKNTTMAVYAFLVLAAYSIFQALVDHSDQVMGRVKGIVGLLMPFVIGFVIAYFLNFLLKFYENKLINKVDTKGKLSRKQSRTIGIFLTYASFLVVFVLLMYLVIPKAVTSLMDLTNNMPRYVNNLSQWTDATMEKYNIDYSYFKDLADKVIDYLRNLDITFTKWIPKIGGVLTSTISGTLNFFIGVVISMYILIEKDRFASQVKMILYSLMKVDKANYLLDLFSRLHRKMKDYFKAQGLDSIIVAIIFFIILFFLKLDYIGIMAFILGVTNMIPWLGPWLGTIPCMIIIMFQDPIKALWFIPIVLVVQQIDGNIINPKIQGGSMGVSAFWIIFAILVGGYVMGPVGMFVAIPFFAVFYSLVREWVQHTLKAKGLPVESADYKDIKLIDTNEGDKE